MAQEDKDLLLIDLCARLPYEVKGVVKCWMVDNRNYDYNGFHEEQEVDVNVVLNCIDITTLEISVYADSKNHDLQDYIEEYQRDGVPWNLEEFKPYLRPMSSMTDEEKKELIRLFGTSQAINPGVGSTPWYNVPETKIELVEFSFRYTHKLIDWLNAHHFDYRGLIEKGLAIAVTEDNNPYI